MSKIYNLIRLVNYKLAKLNLKFSKERKEPYDWFRSTEVVCRKLAMETRHANFKLEPIILKNLPIIPSRTSQNFYL